MQLIEKAKTVSARGGLALALSLATVQLLTSTGAMAQEETAAGPDVVNDEGATRIDSAILFYQEAGGRVKATEPVLSATLNSEDGDALSVKLTSDALTGATPNGAAPWKGVQTFVTPARPPGSSQSVTSASGGSTIISIPGVGIATRQYTAAAGTQPVDAGFHDQRYAVDAGYSHAFTSDTKGSVGIAASQERDYRSFSFSFGGSQDFNHKNTTVSLAANLEFDQSRPFFGTPTPLTQMSATQKGGNATKNVYSVVGGVTQAVTRLWLTQLNFEVGQNDGYQTDPYKIISLVDPQTGGPVQYLYESRPQSRLRESVYWGNKLALGPTFADFSLRAYHDSWGVGSLTAELSERVPILSWLYVEPQARYYSQSAANFYHPYLLYGQNLPKYASADTRLGKFDGATFGLKLGVKIPYSGEIYILGEHYQQTGKSHNPSAPGDLASENLFYGVKATSVMAGLTFAFY